ncbi:MAG: beta-lactamase family protein [Pseudomonadales bacterium]|jgi:CubicO group peptidase (beta-lactamase class C family)|nr:beta-lactamase family protein [Pseudomonadales bacterium]MDP4639985.1 beta-lactamase family protein [Pseudomonadales bacterium]MDP4765335.1 beta-lactamase family protein [Pseudomonadales bacterium]MDP4874537.1 beta-lactamase family protein [Pseudomonadales bacterium]MDP4910512.1 beta-lactamase family protein [Pseudomonadales bacterium]
MRATPEDVGLSAARLYKIDHLTQGYINDGMLPGTITLVARRGKIVHLSCQGKMDIEADKSMEDDTLFRIYSMSKPVTTTALMMLYEDGRFQLDDPVSRFIPAFRELQVYSADGRHTAPARPMTIRDLLTHTSGLTYGFMNSTPVDAMYRQQGVEQSANLAEMVSKLAGIPLLFSPGSRWSYSVATDVCGHLVELIADTPFDEFLEEQIFAPLGMTDTGFVVPEDKVHRFAANYDRTSDNGMRLIDSPESSPYLQDRGLHSGGGGLVSTIHDYYKFASMLLNQGEHAGTRILGRKTVELMTSNHLPNNGDLTSMGQAVFSETPYDGIGFGLGFSVMLDPATAQILGSPGEFAWGGAASTYFFVDPKEDMLVIFMTQLMPSSSYPIRREMRVLAYQSIID